VPFYSLKDFFGSLPGDFGDGMLRRLSANGLPSLPAFLFAYSSRSGRSDYTFGA